MKRKKRKEKERKGKKRKEKKKVIENMILLKIPMFVISKLGEKTNRRKRRKNKNCLLCVFPKKKKEMKFNNNIFVEAI
jgi:serine kinase of HPr protein (carbohydrate metabolism regulator)